MSSSSFLAVDDFFFIDALRDEKPKDHLLDLLFKHRVKFNDKFVYQVESKELFQKFIFDYFTQADKYLFFVFSQSDLSVLGTMGAVIRKNTCELTYILKFQTAFKISFAPIFVSFLEFIRKSWGIKCFELLVRSDNDKALAFYSKCGFIPSDSQVTHSSLIKLARNY